MPNPIRFVLTLHNHQPVGNFDHVFQQAFDDSYRPFLDLFGRYESLKISLHTSGSLMEWLAAHHPEYVDRLAELVAQGRIEILGGAYFEPILSMIPARDRITLCVSSQVGCRFGCAFCASGQSGFVRDLDAGEMPVAVWNLEATPLDDDRAVEDGPLGELPARGARPLRALGAAGDSLVANPHRMPATPCFPQRIPGSIVSNFPGAHSPAKYH